MAEQVYSLCHSSVTCLTVQDGLKRKCIAPVKKKINFSFSLSSKNVSVLYNLQDWTDESFGKLLPENERRRRRVTWHEDRISWENKSNTLGLIWMHYVVISTWHVGSFDKRRRTVVLLGTFEWFCGFGLWNESVVTVKVIGRYTDLINAKQRCIVCVERHEQVHPSKTVLVCSRALSQASELQGGGAARAIHFS